MATIASVIAGMVVFPEQVNLSSCAWISDVDLENVRILSGYPQDMNAGSTTASGWTLYDNIWDSTQSPDGLYLVEITIGDKDIDQHKISFSTRIICRWTNIKT